MPTPDYNLRVKIKNCKVWTNANYAINPHLNCTFEKKYNSTTQICNHTSHKRSVRKSGPNQNEQNSINLITNLRIYLTKYQNSARTSPNTLYMTSIFLKNISAMHKFSK